MAFDGPSAVNVDVVDHPIEMTSELGRPRVNWRPALIRPQPTIPGTMRLYSHPAAQFLMRRSRSPSSSTLATNQMCSPRFDSDTKSPKAELSSKCREISPRNATRTRYCTNFWRNAPAIRDRSRKVRAKPLDRHNEQAGTMFPASGDQFVGITVTLYHGPFQTAFEYTDIMPIVGPVLHCVSREFVILH